MDATMNRRGFVSGAALTAGTALLAGSSAALADEASAGWMPEAWDDEADLVVVGYGGSGAAAAITAAEAGASVIVLEKSAERDGGNTGASSGAIHTGTDVDIDEWAALYAHYSYGEGAPDDQIRLYMEQANLTPAWCEEVGISINWNDMDNNGIQRPAHSKMGMVAGREGSEGRFLFEAIDEAAAARNVDVRLSTRAVRLVQDPATKMVLGVVAQDADGGELAFKARKGVVLACGGYENNLEMQGCHGIPGIRFFPWGTPNNTGDGVTMASAAGAKLWHMAGQEIAALCFTQPSIAANCSISTDASAGIQPYGYVFVGPDGQRWASEPTVNQNHITGRPRALDFDGATLEYSHLPIFMVFDSTMFDGESLWRGTGRFGVVNTYAGVYNANHPEAKLLTWDSNEQALEQGWIFKGETLEELAANVRGTRPSGEQVEGIDAAALAATVAAFNEGCETGEDPFGRDPQKSEPLANPPFYAIEMSFSTINTQGGPERNGRCETIGVDGQPIPHLYNAGELGSFNGLAYTVGNILEALTTGRIAATSALENEPWE